MSFNTDLIFEDEAKERIKKESEVDSFKNQLIVKIKHDSNLSVTGNFAVMKELVKLENELLNGSNPETSWEYDSTFVYKLQTPFQSWKMHSVQEIEVWKMLPNGLMFYSRQSREVGVVINQRMKKETPSKPRCFYCLRMLHSVLHAQRFGAADERLLS